MQLCHMKVVSLPFSQEPTIVTSLTIWDLSVSFMMPGNRKTTTHTHTILSCFENTTNKPDNPNEKD